jgi:hypothetical protein
MEQNVAVLKASRELREGAERLVGRALAMARPRVEEQWTAPRVERGGRKAHRLASLD